MIATTAPAASAPPAAWLNPKNVLASVPYIRQDGSRFADRPAFADGSLLSGQPEYKAVGNSFNDAISTAISLARKNDLRQSQGVMQAKDGAYFVAGLEGYTEKPFPVIYDHAIDGAWNKANGYRGAEVARVDDALKAVVGAYSWVDLRNSASGTRARLPELS